MRRVLILAYYTPPLGMGGTQRVAKFCRYLPEFGWQPILVTVKQPLYYAYDAGLLRDLEKCRVYRTESLDPQRVLAMIAGSKLTPRDVAPSRSRSGKWLSSLFVPDSKLLWVPFATCGAIRVAKRHRPSAVLVSSPPHSSQLAGFLVRRILGIPWVADFRDRWCGGEFQPSRDGIGRKIDCSLARLVAARADGLVAVTAGLAEHLNRLAGRNDAVTIYNGFDEADFPQERRVRTSKERLSLVFAGAVTEVSWPGPLLEGLTRIDQQPSRAQRSLEVHFFGKDLTGKLRRAVAEHGISHLVQIHGYVSHRQAVAALADADVLYLPVSSSVNRSYVPGKLFEYLGSLRPIMATVPAGEARDLLVQLGASWVCDPEDVECVVEVIQQLQELKRQSRLRGRPAQALAPFSRRSQARQLASYLNRVVDRIT